MLPPSGSSEGTCLCATCANPVQCWQWYWMGRYVYDGKRWGGDHNLAGVVMQLPPLLFCAAGGKEVVWWRVWTERNCEVEKGFDVATSWHQSPVEAKVNAINAKKELWKGFGGRQELPLCERSPQKPFPLLENKNYNSVCWQQSTFANAFPFLWIRGRWNGIELIAKHQEWLKRNWISCQKSGMIIEWSAGESQVIEASFWTVHS